MFSFIKCTTKPWTSINGMPQELELLQLMLDKGADVNFFTGHHGILEGIKKYSSNGPRFKAVIEMMEKYDKRSSWFRRRVSRVRPMSCYCHKPFMKTLQRIAPAEYSDTPKVSDKARCRRQCTFVRQGSATQYEAFGGCYTPTAKTKPDAAASSPSQTTKIFLHKQ